MNLIEAYANLDSESKKTQKRLDEKIPRDLANAMKRKGVDNINYRRSNSNGEYGRYPDFENNQYTEITPEEALKLKKQGNADKIKVVVDGEFVDFYDDGSVRTRSEWVRNNFGTVVKNADKIYVVDDSQANAKEKRAKRFGDNSLNYYNNDYFSTGVEQGTIDKDTGKHNPLSKWDKSDVSDALYDIDTLTRQLSNLEKQWEDGDVSRNEYNRKKEEYQQAIKTKKEEIKGIKDGNKNKEYDKRYDADAKRMQSKLTRFKEIRKSPGEEDVKYAQSSLEKAEKEYQDDIAKKQKEIARLQKELDDIQAKGPSSSWRYNSAKNDLERAKANLEKQKKDLADLKAGKWSVDDMTNESLNKNRKPLKESPVYDLAPQYDSRKSFYGKARVDSDNNGKNKLYSYGTLVAEIKDGKPVVYGTFSATTLRHIKEWLQQNGFKSGTSSEIMKMYGVKNESLKKGKNRKLTESYYDNAYNIIMDSVDTIVDEVRDGEDLEDAVHEEIDSHCLIYTDDIFDLARYYNVIDSDELSSNVYEPLFDDLYSRAQDKLES